MDPGWAQLLVAAATGGLAATVITAFVKNWLVHPVISVLYLGEKSGSYGPMTVYQREGSVSFGPMTVYQREGGFPARYLRLKVENTGLSSIKACSGYIIGITKHASGTKTISQQEVVTLGWANHGLGARDIPRGAFFHLDIASLYLTPNDGRLLRVAHQIPSSLEPLFSGGVARYEFEVLIAADNTPVRSIHVEFTYDPGSDELGFKPIDKSRYPWWAFWKWRLLRFTR
jgi:hypothetical protein